MAPRTIAAALTPFTAGAALIDEAAFEPYLAYLQAGGVDGVLALGTTGEGILLSLAERKAAITRFAAGPLTVLAHFAAAARACAPLPFYVYELEKASGYAIPVHVVERLRETVDNVAGMKVSDAPFAKVQPYMLEGLDVFVGAEALIGEGLTAGAAGAVSGLASAFPEVVAQAVRTGDSTAAGELRTVVDRFPRHAALKAVVGARGVPMQPDVRGPLRGLTPAEHDELLAAVG
jgi:4-hydroxy-tetrahydrodipicolinate synthase